MTFGPSGGDLGANLSSNDGGAGQGGAYDFTEILALMDQMKDDLRKELASKKEVDEMDVRMGNIEEDLDNMTISIDVQIKKTKENSEEIESNSIVPS